MNRYPLWKYLLVLLVTILSFVYALPNIYIPDPAVQISGAATNVVVGEKQRQTVEEHLASLGVGVVGTELDEGTILVRLEEEDQQMLVRREIQQVLGSDFVVALNMAPTTPDWLRAIGGVPIALGLDPSGGGHLLLEVSSHSAVARRQQHNAGAMQYALGSP